MRLCLLIAATLVLAPAMATAQMASDQCQEGRVSSEATAGRCCWPGQSWSDASARCEGPPSCPSGLVADGDRCVGAVAAVAAPAPLPDVTADWPTANGPPARHVRPHEEQVADGSMRGTGAGLLVLGYLTQLIVGIAGLATGDECAQKFGALTLVPIVGLAVGSSALDECGRDTSLPLGTGIGLAVLEVIGLALTIRGAIGDSRVVLTPVGGTITLAPFFSPRASGLGLRVTF